MINNVRRKQCPSRPHILPHRRCLNPHPHNCKPPIIEQRQSCDHKGRNSRRIRIREGVFPHQYSILHQQANTIKYRSTKPNPQSIRAFGARYQRNNVLVLDGRLAVPLYALRYGVRFPLHEFICTFLSFVGIGLVQLVSNSYIHLICFIAFCHECGVLPSIDFFFTLFTLG